MRKIALYLVFALAVLPASGSKRVTVVELEKFVTSSHGKGDSKVAQQLKGLELTERLSEVKLSSLRTAVPGLESQQALSQLADQSEFLEVPRAEIPAKAEPAIAQQQEMVTKAVNWAAVTLRRMPNLFATRNTTRFEDTPAVLQQGVAESMSGVFTPYQPLHVVNKASVAVMYRDGKEVPQPEPEQPASSSPAPGLSTSGEFGPILPTVLEDLENGKVTWNHWETDADGGEAAFRYTVAKEHSHFQLEFCCTEQRAFRKFAGYHGEITIRSSDGAILRMTLIADLSKSDPVTKAQIMVEFKSVAFGQEKYVCPVRSISLLEAPEDLLHRVQVPDQAPGVHHGAPVDDGSRDRAPLQIMMNEVQFDHYDLTLSGAGY